MTYSMTMVRPVEDYAQGIQKLFGDIYDEISRDIKDGVMHNLLTIEDETQSYNFLKNQGYDISYKDFLEFVEDCRTNLFENADMIGRFIVENEQSVQELDDEDLERVAGGGLGNWIKSHKKEIIIGAAIVAGVVAVAATTALVISTCGAAAPAAAAVVSVTPQMIGAGSSAKVAAILGTAVLCA